jgi:hypothetical protein
MGVMPDQSRTTATKVSPLQMERNDKTSSDALHVQNFVFPVAHTSERKVSDVGLLTSGVVLA